MIRPCRLAFLLFVASFAAADDPPAPGEETLKEARQELAGNGYDRLQQRFKAVEDAGRSGDASFVPLLFTAAIQAREPAFAVAAGEAANKLDPKAAVRAYDGKLKLRKLPAAQAVGP